MTRQTNMRSLMEWKAMMADKPRPLWRGFLCAPSMGAILEV